MKFTSTLMAAILSLFISFPASAITAGELLKDDGEAIGNYLAGLADMLAYSQFIEGDEDRGNCIYNWYYRTEGAVEKVYRSLEKYPDSAPEAIMIVLAKRPCPLAGS